jgi:methionine synthase II (cobalamin-independent)
MAIATLTSADGASLGLGSLPHRDVDVAVRVALDATTIPTIPTLPKRSPAEGIVAQAVVGIDGVSVGQYGAISVDAARVDPLAPMRIDLDHDAFAAFRAFLDAAPRDLDAVKWQFVGPVTLGGALMRAGVPEHVAFDVATRAVRSHVQMLLDTVAERLPEAVQVVFIDEPDLGDLADPDFVLPPDVAIDLVSAALAAVETRAVSGLHVCGDIDLPSLLAAGAQVMSLPVRPALVDHAGQLAAFLARGGVIAWGAVLTGGPVPTSVERPWRELTALWCQLVERGIDPVVLRRQCLITPECGLGPHAPAVVDRVHRLVREIGTRVREQLEGSRFVLGA